MRLPLSGGGLQAPLPPHHLRDREGGFWDVQVCEQELARRDRVHAQTLRYKIPFFKINTRYRT